MMITLKLVLLALVFLCVENASYSNTLALKAGYMSAVAYENASVIASWQCSPCKKYPITSPTVFSNSTGNIQGFVGYSSVDNAIFVSFRGSQDIKNWILNLETTMTGYSLCSGCQVHKGFYSGFQMVRSQVMTQVQALKAKYPTATILVTGHSLGGALAVLAAVELQNSYGSVADVYTFGQPRVGNIPFAAYYTTHLANTFRVIHYGDIVPHLPPAGFGFYHSSHEIWYDQAMATYNTCQGDSPNCSNSLPVTAFNTNDHDLTNYLKLKQVYLDRNKFIAMLNGVWPLSRGKKLDRNRINIASSQ